MKGIIITILALIIIAAATYYWTRDEAVLNNNDLVVCTMDAMLCPDGSYVGRIPPDCAFAECPIPATTTPTTTPTGTEDNLLRAS